MLKEDKRVTSTIVTVLRAAQYEKRQQVKELDEINFTVMELQGDIFFVV